MPHEGYCDLIYAISVFTHITHDWSARLLELHRILKPDGYLLATIIGPPRNGDASLPIRPTRTDSNVRVQRLGQTLDETRGRACLHSPWWALLALGR